MPPPSSPILPSLTQIQDDTRKASTSSATGRTDKNEPPLPAVYLDTHNVLTSTMNDLPGYRVTRVLGTIYGLTVRSRNWGADLGAIFKSVVGGEIGFFTRMMYTSRNEALERLVGECMARGGNAVLALR